MRATDCNCVMALARIVGTVRRYRADVLAAEDLARQFWKRGGITDMAPRDLDRPNLQCFLVNFEADNAPQTPLWAAVLMRVPFALPLGLDAGAVDQQEQRTR